ncbi:SDR family oxidoreductase [Aliishimia ponticola]|uniref:SDR family oxidoreductase n=1 Tax=Aliishimia ponticola TaxID=2499833 RepID=A0A4S4NCX2_9RHOB|nr:SDR family oxidoreductase [Aliishimia ponticola]THH37302.1 SDR family oxidoreductase [Aliishimia ponticola]
MTHPLTIDLSGKRALVTGASSGLGAHFASVLAGQGADLVLAARRIDKLQEVAEPLRKMGRDVQVMSMDVGSADAVEAAFADMLPCDIVINNSGIGQNSWLVDMEADEWQQLVDINLTGVWRVSKQAVAMFRKAKTAGSIINIASITASRTALKSGAYAVTKAGVVHMTKSLAIEVARDGIRVNALAPGYFQTELNAEFLTSEAGQRMAARIPQRRFGTLEELNLPLLMLAADQNAYMTGATLTVDGGHSINAL